MQIYILMGVSGVGKTTIGKALSEKLKLPFYDADDFHSDENVQKMMSGIPLDDEDRAVWLDNLAAKMKEWSKEGGAVLACSALKEKYRQELQEGLEGFLNWIFLHAEYEVILERISKRKGHYFNPKLLLSQYESLQTPNYGLHIDVNTSVENIVKEIMEKLREKKSKSKIGLVGLGVMGKSLALNFVSKGIKTSVFNRHVAGKEEDIAKNFAASYKEQYDFPWFDHLESFLNSLERPRNIFLMVNAGKAVDAVINDLLPFLEKGDLIIDGGNSHYKDSIRRENELKEKGIFFLGTGISGGEEGARKGPSIMPGGSSEAYERIGNILEEIAAKDRHGKPCCTYIGPNGSGHFTKMLHNGIEYGEMQLIAETYHLSRFKFGLQPEQIAAIFEEWNKEMESYLLEISIKILRKKEDGDFLIDKILDAAKQKGTGGWSTSAALELGVPLDTITAAVLARNLSAKKKERTNAEKAYKTNPVVPEKAGLEEISADLFKAYKAVSIINHAIGFDFLMEAGKSYDWDLNLSQIARIWTNGCIIRSKFMGELVVILEESKTENILFHPEIISRLKENKPSLAKVVGNALQSNFPMPVSASALNYFLGFTSGQSSANMIQAQRDFFGAHTYERTDKGRGEFFHTQWENVEE